MHFLPLALAVCYFCSEKTLGKDAVNQKSTADDVVTLTLDDMKFTLEQEATLKLKNAFVRTQRWPNGIIPYQMSSTIANDYSRKSAIEAGLRIYEQKTCIKWVRRTNERNYVEFMDGGARQCYSMVGMLNEGKQDLSIGKGCEGSVAVIIHEMMHSAGFMHEHMRPDRDKYITLVTSKIIPAMMNQFQKVYPSDVDQQNLAYDYYSVMHYPANAFSVDGSNTIITKDPNAQAQIGQRGGFSKCDLEKLNRWYGCSSKITHDDSCKIDPDTPEPPTVKPTEPNQPPTPPSPPTVQPPTNPPIINNQCTDRNPFTCAMFRNNCYVYPGYYLFECKKTCGNCDGSKCSDTTMFWYQNMCKSVRRNSCIYYMQKVLCPKSCGLC